MKWNTRFDYREWNYAYIYFSEDIVDDYITFSVTNLFSASRNTLIKTLTAVLIRKLWSELNVHYVIRKRLCLNYPVNVFLFNSFSCVIMDLFSTLDSRISSLVGLVRKYFSSEQLQHWCQTKLSLYEVFLDSVVFPVL